MTNGAVSLSAPSAILAEHYEGVSFEDVISPMGLSEFLSNYWCQRFLVCRGWSERWRSVLSWADVNDVLVEQRLQPPRLRLFQDGRTVEASKYLILKETMARLRSSGLMRCLDEGATLVLDQVDECVSGVRRLADSFEDALHVYTSVNLYAGWRTQNGFDLHWLASI
jgi:hypothetical protein